MAQNWEKITPVKRPIIIKSIITGFLNKDKWLGYPLKILSLKSAVN